VFDATSFRLLAVLFPRSKLVRQLKPAVAPQEVEIISIDIPLAMVRG